MEVQWTKQTAAIFVFLLSITIQFATSVANRIPRASSITWSQCDSTTLDDLGATCGFIDVPLDHDDPEGEQITLALARIEADPNAGPFQGAIILSKGDAGTTGLSDMTQYENVNSDVRATYDWIVFDPRGRGDSTPNLRCTDDYFNGPRMNYVPSKKVIRDYWTNRTRTFAGNCRNAYGSALKYYTSLDSVKDIESIRVALDISQVHLFGFGYSTYLFQLYATLYPTRVGRMILDSSVDPRRLGFAYILDQSYRVDENFARYFDWIAQYDSVFNLGSTSCQVAKRWEDTLAALALEPIDDEIGQAAWIEIFSIALKSEEYWIAMAWAFSEWVNNNDPTGIFYFGLYGNNYYAVHLANLCTDARWPAKSTATAVTWRVFAQAPIFTWFNGWSYRPCQYWPVRGSIPVLVDGSGVGDILLISETRDPWNPYEGSLEVRRRFPGARLIAVTDGIHNIHSLQGNACVDNPITAYLTDGTLPTRQPGDVADVECSPLPAPDPTSRATALGKEKVFGDFRDSKQRLDE